MWQTLTPSCINIEPVKTILFRLRILHFVVVVVVAAAAAAAADAASFRRTIKQTQLCLSTTY